MRDRPNFTLRNFGLSARPRGSLAAAPVFMAAGAPVGVLTRHWWGLGLRGLFGIVFGVAAIVMPGLTLASLVLLFAAYLVADGVVALASALLVRRHAHWTGLFIEGVLDLAAAGVMLTWPGWTVMVSVYVIGIWAILSGAALLAAGARLGSHSWGMALAAIASLVFGCLVIISPLTGALVIAVWLGVYAIIFGLALLALAWKLRRLRMRHGHGLS